MYNNYSVLLKLGTVYSISVMTHLKVLLKYIVFFYIFQEKGDVEILFYTNSSPFSGERVRLSADSVLFLDYFELKDLEKCQELSFSHITELSVFQKRVIVHGQ